MKHTTLTKRFAAVTLAAIGITTWAAPVLACASTPRSWGTSYTLYCYNQFGYQIASATGSGTTQPIYPYTKYASISLGMGSSGSIQTLDGSGNAVAGCGAVDGTADGHAVVDYSGCDTAVTFVVSATP